MDPRDLPRPALRRALVADGWSDDELARARRTGDLSRIRRGAYVDGDRPPAVTDRHRLLVQATLAGLRRDAVVSHESAAVLHGLPTWGLSLGRVHVTRRPPASSDASRTLRCHVARLGDDEVTVADGVPVTDPARTALDLARRLPFEVAVVLLDDVLARRLARPGELLDRLGDVVGTRGSRRAARAVSFADGRSESVGESRSRVVLHRLGMTPSGLRHPVHSAEGVLLGRAGFVWEAERLLEEFDGRVEYGRLLGPVRNRATSSSRRSAGSMPCAPRSGTSCAGRGRTSAATVCWPTVSAAPSAPAVDAEPDPLRVFLVLYRSCSTRRARGTPATSAGRPGVRAGGPPASR
ncbi:type IV toxin-antitoxin system AbiEi family antitoxin domain-containing protein [Geodermatophilus maliterrae]|uniref:Transcriptional regulator, AbiEi antitoxin, Type IV TA system n=1 Tax=Geodermatophilus maliterrae TaxID=3162531 RepID=A0ABV3XKS2_9ACTN